MIVNEVSFYTPFSKKLKDYLNTYLGEEYEVYFSTNQTLDYIVSNLETQAKIKLRADDEYIPKLKVDIVFLICGPNGVKRLILIEVKYLGKLTLKDYSQLVGYLQVAKTIDIGLLLLVQKEKSTNKLSNDFQEIIRLKKLPMDWLIDLKMLNEKYKFKTGVIHYLAAGMIDWINTTEINGISSFVELCQLIKTEPPSSRLREQIG